MNLPKKIQKSEYWRLALPITAA